MPVPTHTKSGLNISNDIDNPSVRGDLPDCCFMVPGVLQFDVPSYRSDASRPPSQAAAVVRQFHLTHYGSGAFC